jgi:4-amino-4-deoxy-L-arabinose transferase-like glycosyltransferase
MTIKEMVTKYQVEILLCAILLLSGFLNFWNLWNTGFSNTYYAAAVRSMLENPGVAFFNSFDAAGFVTVDKPPIGLWIQCVSAALLGYSGWALELPQALAGVWSVALVYAIVSRPFGKPAGLVSAFALAVTPIFVAVSRNGTMDGLLIFVLLLALWVALKAAREQSLPLLLTSVFLIGVGFNIKMIQAFIIIPAVFVIYLLGMRDSPRKKQALHIGLALLVLVATSLSWAVAVDLVPASQRPYIGGSGDNTVLGLIVNYNGLHRLENGQMGSNGPDGALTRNGIQPGGPQGVAFTGDIPQNRTADRRMNNDISGKSMVTPGSGQGQFPEGGPTGAPPGTSMTGDTKGGGMMDNSGTPGLFRLFGEGLAGQISWLLPFALIGLLAWWRRPTSISCKGFEDAGLFTDRGLTLLAMGLWLLPGLIYFSFTTGFWHTYYIATIAPPLAALVGIGAVGMYEAYQSNGFKGWIFVAAVPVTGLIEILFLYYDAEWSGVLIPILLAGIIVVSILLFFLKMRDMVMMGNLRKTVACAAIAILFIAPMVWACTPLMYGNGGIMPVAGPQLVRGAGIGSGFRGNTDGVSPLAEYLVSHKTTETWLVGVPSANSEGAGLIINTGLPVMSMGGFSGSDQILTVDSLKGLIDTGRIRYFLGSSSGGMGGLGSGNSGLFTWISGNCTEVPAADWGGSAITVQDRVAGFGNMTSTLSPGFNNMPGLGASGPGGQNTLYDCAGYRGQTSA